MAEHLGGALAAVVRDEDALAGREHGAHDALEAGTDQLRAQVLLHADHRLAEIKTNRVFGVRRQCDAIAVPHTRRRLHLLNDATVPELVRAGRADPRPDDRPLRQTLSGRHFVVLRRDLHADGFVHFGFSKMTWKMVRLFNFDRFIGQANSFSNYPLYASNKRNLLIICLLHRLPHTLFLSAVFSFTSNVLFEFVAIVSSVLARFRQQTNIENGDNLCLAFRMRSQSHFLL